MTLLVDGAYLPEVVLVVGKRLKWCVVGAVGCIESGCTQVGLRANAKFITARAFYCCPGKARHKGQERCVCRDKWLRWHRPIHRKAACFAGGSAIASVIQRDHT